MPSFLTAPYTQTSLDQPGPSSPPTPSSSLPAARSANGAMSPPRARRSQTSTNTGSPPLDSVPEDASFRSLPPAARSPPPSMQSRRSHDPARDGRDGRGPALGPALRQGDDRGAGKGRAVEAAYPAGQPRMPKTDWLVDLVEARNGAESWECAERVILVLGDASPDLLAPLLLNPTFARTLILVGSTRPKGGFDSLATYFPNRTIYPIVQSCCPPSAMLADASHPLPALITHALILADAYRRNPRALRRNSDDSDESLTPPLTPRASRLSLFRRGSDASAKSDPDGGRLSFFDRSGSSNSLADRSPRSRLTTLPSFSRGDSFSSSGGKRDFAVAPFDAVLHFVPSANASPRALQDLLHQSMVLTTALMPHLAPRRKNQPATSVALADAVSLLHVLPSDAPTVLGPVVEQLITSLQPALANSARPVFAAALSAQAWLCPRVDGGVSDAFTGAEVVLFGGVKNVPASPPRADLAVRQRAYMRSWADCVVGPGVLADARLRAAQALPSPQPASPDSMRSTRSGRANPPSVPYASTVAPAAAPAVPPKSLPRSTSGLRHALGPDDLAAPVPAPRAAAASRPGSVSDESDRIRTPDTTSEGSVKGAKGIKKWFRRKGVTA